METNQQAGEKASLALEGGQERPRPPMDLPIATIAIIVITAIVTSLQFFYPVLLPMLDRNLGALQAGQWWRLITPRFVQPDIWPQYVLLTILAVVGPPVERRFGSLRWLILWFVGGLMGEVVSFMWEPHGAGASIGLCGIIGAWLILLLRQESEGSPTVAVVVFALIANLIGLAATTPTLAAMLAAIIAGLMIQLCQRAAMWQQFAPWLGGVGLFSALLLIWLRDQHGPPLIAGAVVAFFLLQ